MTLDEYQEFTKAMDIRPIFEHLMPSYTEELGELMGHFKRYYRDDTPFDIKKMKKEQGDILWTWSEINRLLGISNQEVMDANIDKLLDRFERDVLHGAGDDR